MDETGTPADASSLIYLAKAGALAVTAELLGPLLVTPAVWREAVELGEGHGRPDASAVRVALEKGTVRQVRLEAAESERAIAIAKAFGLGAGESEVLAIGFQRDAVLVDERRASRAAGHLGILCVETILLPGLCAQTRILDRDRAFALLDELARHTTIPGRSWARARALILEAKR